MIPFLKTLPNRVAAKLTLKLIEIERNCSTNIVTRTPRIKVDVKFPTKGISFNDLQGLLTKCCNLQFINPFLGWHD